MRWTKLSKIFWLACGQLTTKIRLCQPSHVAKTGCLAQRRPVLLRRSFFAIHITGKHINYYHICHRKLWLFASGLSFQQDNEHVQDGTLLHLSAYPQRARRFREVQLGGIKIDFYDPVDRVVHEIKRSQKLEEASVAQLKYYLRVLEQHGVAGPTGVLEYPKLRRTQEVALAEQDRADIEAWEAGVAEVVARAQCPPVIDKPFCKNCAYYEFCYVHE